MLEQPDVPKEALDRTDDAPKRLSELNPDELAALRPKERRARAIAELTDEERRTFDENQRKIKVLAIVGGIVLLILGIISGIARAQRSDDAAPATIAIIEEA